MERLSSVWAELQKSNRLPSGSLMSSCQTELQELMYQLDVMLSAKKQQWMQETDELQARLLAKEKELRSQQTALEIKTREMEDMKNQMEGLNKAQKAIVDEYEDHLSKLRAEVLKVRKEYERLQKQHQRYKKDLQRKKDQAMDEKKEGEEEIRRLREKLEEYDSREREWEHKVRGLQHEIDMLETQKRTLSEKCEFVQQQSHTYQSQVSRRREMQDTAEDSLKSRITQLEANVERSTQTMVAQKEKIERLKGSLEDAMSSHKQTMGDNEKLLADLQKANETIQMLEERIAELEGELHSKGEQLRTAQEDSLQYCQDLSRMELTLNAKDNIIKHMSESHDFEESDQVKKLKEALQNAREDLKSQKQKNKQLKQSLTAAPTSIPTTATSISSSSASSSAAQRGDIIMEHSSPQQAEDKELEHNPEVHRLQLEVKKLQDKLVTVNDTHSTELTAMRQKLGELTTDLHQRNTLLASLSERSSELERSMREESDGLDKKVAELKVTQSQVDSLRAENRHLRRELLQMEQDHNESHSPNTQSHMMRREMNVLRNSVEDVEQIIHSQHNSARTDASHTSMPSDRHSGSIGNTESGSERFSAMDDYLESSIRRYDDQLQFLEAQKARLEAQMSQGSRQSLRIATEERKLHEAGSRRPAQFVYHPDESQGSEPMSLVSERQYPKVDRLELPHSSSEDELPDMAEEATQAFFEKEHEHASELERRLNAQINNFTHGMGD